MKAVIQIVTNADVFCENKTVGKIEKGLLVLLGVESSDTEKEADLMASKIAALRIFPDENDKMNLSVTDVDGEILAVSNFTLCADASHGRRPSYSNAMRPDGANGLYEKFCELLLKNGVRKVEKGIFGGDMKVTLTNDGPITLILDTAIWS